MGDTNMYNPYPHLFQVEALVKKILSGHPLSPSEYMDLNSAVYKIVDTPQTNYEEYGIQVLTVKFAEALSSYIEKIAQESNQMMNSVAASEIMQAYLYAQDTFKNHIGKLQHICAGYEKKVKVSKERDFPKSNFQSIQEIALYFWAKNLFVPYSRQVVSSCIGLYHQSLVDDSEPGNKLEQIKSFTNGLLEMGKAIKNPLGIYENYMEKYFIESRERSLQSLYTDFLGFTCDEYFDQVSYYRQAEESRLQQAFDATTVKKILNSFDHIFVVQYIDRMGECFDAILTKGYENNADTKGEFILEKLTKIYNLVKCTGNEHLMQQFITCFIDQAKKSYNACLDKIETEAQPKEEILLAAVSKMVFVHDQMENILKTMFADKMDILNLSRSNFCQFLSQRKAFNSNASVPFQLAVYLDLGVMRKNKKLDNEEKVFGNIMRIYEFINNKDEFLMYHKDFLSKRLIGGGYSSLELEELFLDKYLGQFGTVTLNPLKKMIKDTRLSIELMTDFNQATQGQIECPLDVLILSSNVWQIKEKDPENYTLNCPKDLGDKLSLFYVFYNKKFNDKRKLEWIYPKFRGEYFFNPPNQKKVQYTITASVYQMATLLQFQNGETKSKDEIQKATGIQDFILDDHVFHSLTRLKLLIKTPGTDSYTLKDDFRHKNKELKINIPIKKKSTNLDAQSQKVSNELIDFTKRLQASAVRIIKSKGEAGCQHQILIEEISKDNVEFSPEMSMIEAAIKFLIDQGFAKIEQAEVGEVIKFIPESAVEAGATEMSETG